ncbi:hypothetical protein VB620_02185 [Nodularia harveyana UHCC-0300]|uniref:DUF2281 domain-containing protein n=1 Tax=Nodularia harveyana UHCC-0300 TaxID=2974287 RepID=A0ABU5UB15_9CYAN|nr:hypothetical protein [Nodularia harveyana]MEA5580146.1 hypothetical protein [Nodularia harveyana UHCC-0300]
MLQSIEGVYKHGKVELREIPSDIGMSRVIVTFLDARKNQPKKQMMSFGIFHGNHQSTAADFHIAEFYDDIEDSLDW